MTDLMGTISPGAIVAETVLKYWGYDRLRPLQAEAIEAGLTRRDSLVVMPTGGGKSLCYQVPAVIAGGTDVVLSPLISLMKDQVDGLRECGYPAAAINSGMPRDELSRIEADAAAGKYRLLFVAPERLQSSYFQRLLDRIRVRAFAVDEAHCISHWGHDFRQEYRQLAFLKQKFPEASVHAFTATATQRVRTDIVQQLGLRDPLVLVGCFDRPNLVYRVVPRDDSARQTLEIVQRHRGKAVIVYCNSRADTEFMAEHLRVKGRVRAAHYHAGMSPEDRRKTQDLFAEEKLDVIVATVAFGMGIDRGDVRCVIHAGMPKSVEHYQQETGRAGRDGLEAECVLLYSMSDMIRWETLVAKNAADAASPEDVIQASLRLLADMRRYASGLDCRHKTLSEYFGQKYEKPSCGACDVCLSEHEDVEDGTVLAQKILSCVARTGERFGVGHVVDVLVGAKTERVMRFGHESLSTHGLLKGQDKKALAGLVYQLVDQGLLMRDGGEMPIIKLNAASWQVMRGQRTVKLRRAAAKVAKPAAMGVGIDGVDEALFERLRGVRRELAEKDRVPAFVILGDVTLREMARLRPGSLETLRRVRGIGEQKLQKFGRTFLSEILRYCQEAGLPIDPDAGDQAEQSAIVDRNRTRAQAFALFSQGASVDAVVERTGRARSTVYGYLADFIAETRPRSVDPWVDRMTYARVRDAAMAAGDERSTPIFEKLGGAVSYDDIRVVMRHLTAVGA